jgi:hypothetical protein
LCNKTLMPQITHPIMPTTLSNKLLAVIHLTLTTTLTMLTIHLHPPFIHRPTSLRDPLIQGISQLAPSHTTTWSNHPSLHTHQLLAQCLPQHNHYPKTEGCIKHPQRLPPCPQIYLPSILTRRILCPLRLSDRTNHKIQRHSFQLRDSLAPIANRRWPPRKSNLQATPSPPCTAT